MFEVGKWYTFVRGYGETQGQIDAQVLEADLPLIKISVPGGGYEIVNTYSPDFHSAELSKHQR